MTIFKDTATIHHATRAKANKLAEMPAAEYPALTLTPVYDDIDKVIGFETSWSDEPSSDEPRQMVLATKKVPELAAIFDACDDLDLDPEAIEAAETRQSGSVVDVIYKSQYREQSSNGQTCGDWLAEWLTSETTIGGKLDIEGLHELFILNGLDLNAKWALVYDNEAKQSRGWTGRYRMSGRIALEKVVAKAGEATSLMGLQVVVPADALAILRGKHAKWLAKEAKAEAAADALAEA